MCKAEQEGNGGSKLELYRPPYQSAYDNSQIVRATATRNHRLKERLHTAHTCSQARPANDTRMNPEENLECRKRGLLQCVDEVVEHTREAAKSCACGLSKGSHSGGMNNDETGHDVHASNEHKAQSPWDHPSTAR